MRILEFKPRSVKPIRYVFTVDGGDYEQISFKEYQQEKACYIMCGTFERLDEIREIAREYAETHTLPAELTHYGINGRQFYRIYD